MSGSYFLYGFILEKYGFFLKNGGYGGNTAWADMAGLGSIGLRESESVDPSPAQNDHPDGLLLN